MKPIDLDGARERMYQELARHAAQTERATANLKRIAAQGKLRAAKARKLLAALRPGLEKWVKAGMPDDEGMKRKAQLYQKAVETLHDAELGQLLAEKHLAEQ